MSSQSQSSSADPEASMNPVIETASSSPIPETAARSLMSRIKVELIVFLGTMSIAVRTITQQQLLQDKICLQKFRVPPAYCQDLNNQIDSPLKDAILSNFSTYSMMKEVIILVPHVLTVLFIGAWCDRFAKGRRYCMIVGTMSLVLEVALMAVNAVYYELSYITLIFSYLPSSLMGSSMGLMITFYSYIVAYVPASDRAFKLVLISVIMSLGSAIGVFAGGLILQTEPLFFPSQIRNYAGVFLLSGISVTMQLILVICCMQEEPDRMIERTHNKQENLEEVEPLITASDIKQKNEIKRTRGSLLCDILSLSNLYDIMQSLIKQRKGSDRKILILLVLSFIPLAAPIFGREAVVFPIVQKLYQWSSFDYSNVSMIGALIHPIVTLFFMPLMFKRLKARDLEVAMIGAFSYAIGNLFLGTFGQISPVAYFVSLILTSFIALIGHGIRAHISRIVPPHEVGKFFSLIAMFEALLPFTGSLIMSAILQASISFYPALVFQFTALSLIIGLAVLMYVDLISLQSSS